MRRSHVVALVLVLALSMSSSRAAAQTVRTPVAPAPAMADMQKLQTAMMAAQAAAIKPGDEALPCEALQKELVSTMNDPAIQEYATKTNAAYARELEKQKTKGLTTPEAAAALAAALTPGMTMAGMAPPAIVPGQQITPQQMQQAMVAQQQATVAYMNQLAPIMPVLMRSQRVTQLAVVKNCTWATGGLGLYPGVAPGVVPRPVRPQ
jgi:hypothetical protein